MLLSQLGRRAKDESDFPSSHPPFVGSDVNTVCSSAPAPDRAIWDREGAVDPKKVPIKPMTMTHCISAGA